MITLHNHDFTLTAADCTSQREMSLTFLVNTIIETATEHANILGCGFERLIQDGNSWVLSRLSIEMSEPAQVSHRFSLLTWVAGINRMFSERYFELVDLTDNRTIGYARSTWMSINMETRSAGDLSALEGIYNAVIDRDCPIERQGRLSAPVETTSPEREYRFAVSDIDVNAHVTTRRYIELTIDCWDLDMYDRNRISRFDIAFKREARYGETARVTAGPSGDSADSYSAAITCGDTVCSLAKITFTPRT